MAARPAHNRKGRGSIPFSATNSYDAERHSSSTTGGGELRIRTSAGLPGSAAPTGNRPSAKQIDDAKKMITDLAAKLGWKPQQLQATLWAAHIIKQGKMPETYHDRLKELKHAGQIDDITGR